MKIFIYISLISIFIALNAFSGDKTDRAPDANLLPDQVPQHIISLKEQIRIAEENENWLQMENLRAQLIREWGNINPDIAKLYNTVNIEYGLGEAPMIGHAANEAMEFYPTSLDWGNDVIVHNGQADDISMDISRDGSIYAAVMIHNTSDNDSMFIYNSTNGGLSWALQGILFHATADFTKLEIMCFDGFPGSTGPSYILLFFTYSSGTFWVGRTETTTPFSWTFEVIVSSDVLDFAVDRNYPNSNYRAIALFDSSDIISSIRSDPVSLGTVWQDKASLGLVGKDVDLCYGYNGTTYATFNGFNTGNLYAFENLNSGDPTSWGSSSILVNGTVNTTKHAEVIASREVAASNTVNILFAQEDGSTQNLYSVSKSGGGSWGTPAGWVVNTDLDFIHTNAYSRKVNGNKNFEATFTRTELNNLFPRQIRYKHYDGTNWTTSIQISDFETTGLQNSIVGDLDGSTAVVVYTGPNGQNMYFDNQIWVGIEDTPQEITVKEYQLHQNYPNPFNPETTIEFSVPFNSRVKLEVFNSLGQKVKSLVNEDYSTGSYSVIWNGTNDYNQRVPSGIYFYIMTARDFQQTQKMLLMK